MRIPIKSLSKKLMTDASACHIVLPGRSGQRTSSRKTPCWNFFLSITLYLCPRMTIVSAYVILSRVFDVNWVTCVLCSEWKKLSGHIPLKCVPLKLEIKSLNEFKWDHSHRRIYRIDLPWRQSFGKRIYKHEPGRLYWGGIGKAKSPQNEIVFI